jgi:energy-coupling factor transport system permease protein
VASGASPRSSESEERAPLEVADSGRQALPESDRAFLASLAPATPSPYHRLNPLTKAAAAITATLGTLVAGGFVLPALILAGLVLPGALAAGVTRRALRWSIAVSLPIAISVAIVSILGRTGTTVLFAVGPFDATLEGVVFAAGVAFRLSVLAMALALFGLTTEPRAFVADLERRGVSARLTFAAAATLDAVPAMAERARTIREAQRARGLDTEGSVGARLRGVLPLVGPAILGALHDVEVRSLALEARAFDRPGPRHVLWAPADSDGQRAARWVLLAILAVPRLV